MRIGATLDKTALDYWRPKLVGNDWMRIFPNSVASNTALKFPPPWTDNRFVYCKAVGADPFISCKLQSDATQLANLRQHLIDMPSWIETLWITDHHEPESDMPPATYKANFMAFWNMIQSLPAATRAKTKAGPILTNINTEDKFNGDYSIHDPGVGDFFGVDTYVRSYQGSPAQVITSFPANAATFLASIKNYNAGSRPKCFPELGGIGIPADNDGSARAAFMQRIYDEVKTWPNFLGWCWWNDDGTTGSALPGSPGIGSARYFQLDRRHTGANDTTLGTGNAFALINPALPLAKYNAIYTADKAGTTVPDPPVDPPPDPEPDPPTPTDPPVVLPTTLPISGPAAARLMHADYTVLVTDANCNVIGDPLHEWKSLNATLRWKEPGSGQFVIPNYPYVNAQLEAGRRIVILRRVLGLQHILISGPIEDVNEEWSDDGEKGGMGELTVSFVDDMGWLGARLAYPDPTKTIENQTTDFWTYTGNPELGMLQLVNGQAATGALAARRVPSLVTAAFSGVSGTGTVKLGPTTEVSPRERLEKVTDVLRKMATVGVGTGFHPDSLGFRVRQVTNQILFEVLRSTNLAGQVHFSAGMGNLKYYSFQRSAPKLTHLLVGGQADMSDPTATANRFIREFATADADTLKWGRFEGYTPRPGTDTLAQMQEVAKTEMVDTGQSARLAVSASDTVDQRYGIHYNVGDIVSVGLASKGAWVSAPVQTVNLQAWPTAGEVVGTTIGDQSARYDSAWIRKMRDIDRRIGKLERRF